ncbi:hypothetical protein BDR26DRAFT_872296 [Obelidium mucronatum]|nr:hypothetical protein BDR26DRAFT_872296 [Obelidium mucronatum]
MDNNILDKTCYTDALGPRLFIFAAITALYNSNREPANHKVESQYFNKTRQYNQFIKDYASERGNRLFGIVGETGHPLYCTSSRHELISFLNWLWGERFITRHFLDSMFKLEEDVTEMTSCILDFCNQLDGLSLKPPASVQRIFPQGLPKTVSADPVPLETLDGSCDSGPSTGQPLTATSEVLRKIDQKKRRFLSPQKLKVQFNVTNHVDLKFSLVSGTVPPKFARSFEKPFAPTQFSERAWGFTRHLKIYPETAQMLGTLEGAGNEEAKYIAYLACDAKVAALDNNGRCFVLIPVIGHPTQVCLWAVDEDSLIAKFRAEHNNFEKNDLEASGGKLSDYPENRIITLKDNTKAIVSSEAVEFLKNHPNGRFVIASNGKEEVLPAVMEHLNNKCGRHAIVGARSTNSKFFRLKAQYDEERKGEQPAPKDMFCWLPIAINNGFIVDDDLVAWDKKQRSHCIIVQKKPHPALWDSKFLNLQHFVVYAIDRLLKRGISFDKSIASYGQDGILRNLAAEGCRCCGGAGFLFDSA